LAGALLYLLLRDTGGPQQGSAAPAVWLQTLDGSSQQLVPSTTRTRPLLVKVFASWCGACRRSVWLDDVADLDSRTDLDHVTVSVDDDVADARRARAEWPIKSPVLFDREQAFSQKYGIKVLPTYILIDTSGRITRVTTGLPGPLDYKAWHDAD
jgi:thiol-disulfide isomerase/thioredoxin